MRGNAFALHGILVLAPKTLQLLRLVKLGAMENDVKIIQHCTELLGRNS